MRRFLRPLSVVLVGISGFAVRGPAARPAVAAGPGVRVHLPAAVVPGETTAIRLTLPARAWRRSMGGCCSRVGSMELVGVAPVGGGTGLRPVTVRGGAAFGAYDLRPTGGAVAPRPRRRLGHVTPAGPGRRRVGRVPRRAAR